MIKKLFFPATFITQRTVLAVNRRLGRFALYQPIMDQTPRMLAHLSETAAIELRHPVIGNESYLLELCRAYDRWGSIHQKDALRLSQLAGTGFYNQDFAADIRTEVLKRKNGVEPESGLKADPMVNARMFLQLAQEFDLNEWEIRLSLEKADSASKTLFEQLRGEGLDTVEPFGSGDLSASDDPCAVMTESRMAAWALLARSDTSPPDLFLTDSRAVMDALTERFPAIVRLLQTDKVCEPVLVADALSTGLPPVAGSPWQGAKEAARMFSYLDHAADDGYILEAYAIPDCSPAKVIASLTDAPFREEGVKGGSRHAFFCRVARAGA